MVPGAATIPWTAAELLRHARLETLNFHHQVAGQPEFDAGITRRAESPVIDLSAGWAAYLEALKGAHAGSLSALQRKMRKMERKLGPLRFVPHAPTPEVLARLVEWKRAQLARTGSRGSLSHEWGVQVIERLNVVADEDFAGIMSALYAGDRLVAVHAGIRTARTWHYWFPTYDSEAGAYSPGLAILYEMCRWACDHGITHVDLGPGEGAHKELFANANVVIGVGQVTASSRTGLVARVMRRLAQITRPGRGSA